MRCTSRYTVLFCEVGLFVACVVTAATAIGDTTYPNSTCGPTTVPVTTCDCPYGTASADRCKGTLPKGGSNYYGDVNCTANPNTQCTQGSGENMNACGIIVMCPCATCGQIITYYPMDDPNCECVEFPTKPQCKSCARTLGHSLNEPSKLRA